MVSAKPHDSLLPPRQPLPFHREDDSLSSNPLPKGQAAVFTSSDKTTSSSRTPLLSSVHHAAAHSPAPPHRRRNTLALSPSSLFGFLKMSPSNASLRSLLGFDTVPQPGQIDHLSLAVVYVVILFSEASRGLMLPSTWPYLRSLGGTKAELGVFVASFSLGRMATTVPLGYLSDKFSMATVLIVASIIQIIGHAFYAVAPTVNLLIAARIVVGFGSSTMAVCRAHVTRAVPRAVRTYHFAYLSALQFVGFAVLPGLGGLLAHLPVYKIFPGVVLNGYTYPALVLILCNVLAVALIFTLYVNPPREQRSPALSTNGSVPHSNVTAPSSRTSQTILPVDSTSGEPSGANTLNGTTAAAIDPAGNPSHVRHVNGVGQTLATSAEAQPLLPSDNRSVTGEDDSPSNEPKPDFVALIVCLLVNVSFRGISAELETVATPFLMSGYGLTYSQTSYYISLVGLVGLGVYVFFKPIASRFSDRSLLRFGLLAGVFGVLPLAISSLAPHITLPMYVFLLGVIWSIAYPIGQTAVLSLFSKVLAGLPAGGFLGLFSMSGSVARIAFAVFAGSVWGMFGREAVFATVIGYIVFSLVMTSVFYERLLPGGTDALGSNPGRT